MAVTEQSFTDATRVHYYEPTSPPTKGPAASGRPITVYRLCPYSKLTLDGVDMYETGYPLRGSGSDYDGSYGVVTDEEDRDCHLAFPVAPPGGATDQFSVHQFSWI